MIASTKSTDLESSACSTEVQPKSVEPITKTAYVVNLFKYGKYHETFHDPTYSKDLAEDSAVRFNKIGMDAFNGEWPDLYAELQTVQISIRPTPTPLLSFEEACELHVAVKTASDERATAHEKKLSNLIGAKKCAIAERLSESMEGFKLECFPGTADNCYCLSGKEVSEFPDLGFEAWIDTRDNNGDMEQSVVDELFAIAKLYQETAEAVGRNLNRSPSPEAVEKIASSYLS